MREEYSPFLRGLCQHRWDVYRRQPYILELDKVQSRLMPEQPPHNVAVEVFVGDQQEHRSMERIALQAQLVSHCRHRL